MITQNIFQEKYKDGAKIRFENFSRWTSSNWLKEDMTLSLKMQWNN